LVGSLGEERRAVRAVPLFRGSRFESDADSNPLLVACQFIRIQPCVAYVIDLSGIES
jgi:hypothetical protein